MGKQLSQRRIGVMEPAGLCRTSRTEADTAILLSFFGRRIAGARRSIEMFEYRQVLMRLRQGDSERDIARSKLMGRAKAACFRELARGFGWLEAPRSLPEDAEIAWGRWSMRTTSCGVNSGRS